MRRDLHEQNRRSWNLATRVHNARKRDQAGFLRSGGSTLFPEEIGLLGPLAGKQLVHLQCNAGQDTLSLAALGAEVLGVDISDEAIDFATRLSADSGVPGRFLRSDVYDWFDAAPQASADVVFCSYGWLGWLSDLPRWARGIRRVLRPGGRFVAVEFDPIAFAHDAGGRWEWPVRSEEPIASPDGIGDYVGLSGEGLTPMGLVPGDPWDNPEPCWEFGYSSHDPIQALLGAGMALERLESWPFANGCDVWGNCRMDAERRMWPPEQMKGMPMMFGLVARAPA